MASTARFDPTTLQQLERAREVRLETTALDSSKRHRTIIWIVTAGGEAFVRSYRGAKGRWYREVRARPEAVLHVDGEAIPVTLAPAADPDSIQRVSDAFTAKYGAHSRASTASMLQPNTLETTLRVEPRADATT